MIRDEGGNGGWRSDGEKGLVLVGKGHNFVLTLAVEVRARRSHYIVAVPIASVTTPELLWLTTIRPKTGMFLFRASRTLEMHSAFSSLASLGN